MWCHTSSLILIYKHFALFLGCSLDDMNTGGGPNRSTYFSGIHRKDSFFKLPLQLIRKDNAQVSTLIYTWTTVTVAVSHVFECLLTRHYLISYIWNTTPLITCLK